MPINISIRVMVPSKSLFDSDKWVREVESVMHQKTAPDLNRYFKGTTEGWKKQPNFSAHHYKTSSSIGVQVYTNNAVYGIVNAGVPKHRIFAKRGGMMVFKSSYRASTSSGSLMSRANQKFGPTWRARSVVWGIKARAFDELISEEYGSVFADDMAKTFEAGLP